MQLLCEGKGYFCWANRKVVAKRRGIIFQNRKFEFKIEVFKIQTYTLKIVSVNIQQNGGYLVKKNKL